MERQYVETNKIRQGDIKMVTVLLIIIVFISGILFGVLLAFSQMEKWIEEQKKKGNF